MVSPSYGKVEDDHVVHEWQARRPGRGEQSARSFEQTQMARA
jgi:hypothetical protein